jgi:2,3,4,5-tetrahydropyridine-2,6-dicarboxylate N-succinyltransferase
VNQQQLKDQIEKLMVLPPDEAREEGIDVVARFRDGLNRGEYRAAEKVDGVWRANPWVKRGILLSFRIGRNQEQHLSEEFRFRDKDTLPLRLGSNEAVRIVPGGSSIRDGAYIGRDVICMPPMFVNIGAWVDDESMVDSHALVGSCAQIGKRVHLSAAAQIGGVLEPPGAVPVVIEDGAFIGGNCGVYEGVIVEERAVLAPGVLLTGGVTVYDTVREQVYRRTLDSPLMIPPGAVVVPGARGMAGNFGALHALSLYAPVIVKYRDEKTDAATSLEEALR